MRKTNEIQRMKSQLIDRFFTVIYSVLFTIGLLSLLFIQKGNIVIYLNSANTPLFDVFFKYVTYIGDGILFVPLIVLLLFVRYSYAIMAAIIAVGHGIILSILKKVVFKGTPRPTAYFEDTSMLHFIDGVNVHANNSFPSGHTATAFAFCLFLTFLINRKSWGFVLMFLAIMGGYSRIYLLQHFYIDTIVGGLIGVVVTIITWEVFKNKTKPDWFNNRIDLSKKS